MIDTLTLEFARQGLGYLIAVLLIGVVIWQQRRLDAKDKQITDLQDKRVIDTNAYTSSYSVSVREMVVASKDTLNSLTLLQRSVDGLAIAFQRLLDKG